MQYSRMSVGGLVCVVVAMLAGSGAFALTGSGDSPVGALETVAPVFSGLEVNPPQAGAGFIVTITFTVSESLAANPVVTVNGNPAAFVSEAKAGNYTYDYTVQGSDAIGTAVIEISGSDLLGNAGSLSSGLVLEIQPMPVHAWPVFVGLLAVGVAVLAFRRRKGAALVVLLLLAAPVAVAQAPVVSNVAFVQRPAGPGGTEVVITYDLVAPNGPCDITVSLSKDGGTDGFSHAVTSVTGALAGVTTGADHSITWAIAADYPDENIPNARIRVTAIEGLTERTILLPGDVPLELVWVPSGSFQMGRYPGEADSYSREDPQHGVTLAYGFWMGKYEVTQEQWLAVRGSWPGTAPSSSFGLGDTYPAYYISWTDAKDFITSLNAHIVSSGQGPLTVRLPSEAEWEYACRAGTQTRFYFGDSLGCAGDCSDCAAGVLPGNRSDYMWYCGNNSPNGSKPVGGKTANAFWLYDMSGNVWEWCEDDYHGSYTGAPADGSAWIDSPRASSRMVRGGSWSSDAGYCRSACRNNGAPGNRYGTVGFRLAAVQ